MEEKFFFVGKLGLCWRKNVWLKLIERIFIKFFFLHKKCTLCSKTFSEWQLHFFPFEWNSFGIIAIRIPAFVVHWKIYLLLLETSQPISKVKSLLETQRAYFCLRHIIKLILYYSDNARKRILLVIFWPFLVVDKWFICLGNQGSK